MKAKVGRLRSRWKPLACSVFLAPRRKATYVYNRAAIVVKHFVGRRFRVYRGKNYVNVTIIPEMVGLKFGEFTLTTSMGSKIHNTAKNKSKNRLRNR